MARPKICPELSKSGRIVGCVKKRCQMWLSQFKQCKYIMDTILKAQELGVPPEMTDPTPKPQEEQDGDDM